MTTTAARSTRVTGSYLQQLLDASAGITPTEESAPTAGQPATHGAQHPAPAALLPTHPGVDATAPVVTAAQATTARRSGSRDTGAETAVATAACVSACTDTAPDPTSPAPADWTRFGIVVPVLAGGPGAGASVLAVVLADALAARGLRVLLVDAADPLRSGLALAAATDGPTTDGPHPGVSIRHAHRGPIRVARLEFTGLPLRSLRMVPAPAYFAPTPDPAPATVTGDKAEAEAGEAVDVTVVDLGWDPWAVAGLPLQGPGGWLRTG